jgi:hypothetical protein
MRILLAMFCRLTFAASARAECAWLPWAEAPRGPKGK